MVWIIECRAADILHKTCGNDTSLPPKPKKNISQGSIGPYDTPNNCRTETVSQTKFTFHLCCTHVLFSNITSIKRQMQRQERTGHFHVNSKKGWNIIHDEVKNRVQNNWQFTQDLRRRHKSSIEAEKKSHGEALDLTTRQNICEPGKKPTKNSPFNYVRPLCYFQTSQA